MYKQFNFFYLFTLKLSLKKIILYDLYKLMGTKNISHKDKDFAHFHLCEDILTP